MAIVLVSQTRSLRKCLKDLDDIENKWIKEHPKIVSHEDVVRRDDLVARIQEAGFKVHRQWDYDNDCQITTLSWTEYPKDEEDSPVVPMDGGFWCQGCQTFVTEKHKHFGTKTSH